MKSVPALWRTATLVTLHYFLAVQPTISERLVNKLAVMTTLRSSTETPNIPHLR